MGRVDGIQRRVVGSTTKVKVAAAEPVASERLAILVVGRNTARVLRHRLFSAEFTRTDAAGRLSPLVWTDGLFGPQAPKTDSEDVQP